MNQIQKRLRESKLFSEDRAGFALVSTLTVMILLMMVALGLISLAGLESRGALVSKARLEAQANARMALMLAVGELQVMAGPDQRVSARADIHSGVIDGKRHWTGFWNTTNWDPENPEKREFVGWGVSTRRGDLGEADVEQELSGDHLVTLVGEGSVKELADQVRVEKVDLMDGNKLKGEYAWWIGDEGIKGSYYVPRIGESDWNKLGVLGVAAKSGISSLGFDGYEDLEEVELFSSALSRKSIGLPSGLKDLSRDYFHDVTPRAVNLLTDTRLGGARRDLSTAFELSLDDFNQIGEFHAAGEKNETKFYDELGGTYQDSRFYPASNSPELGYVCEVPYGSGNGFVRGVSWDYLRNHYRFYKREWEQNPWSRSVANVPSGSFEARGSLPHSYSNKKDGNNDVGGDTFAYHTSHGHLYSKGSFGAYASAHSLNEPRGTIASGSEQQLRTVEQSPRLTPIVTRITIAMGLVKRRLENGADWSLAVSFDPYLTIMNPYNVPLTFDSVGLWSSKFAPLQVKIEYTDKAGDQKVVEAQRYFFTTKSFTRGTFNLILDPALASGGSYTLSPGEVRVISPSKVASANAEYSGINMMRGGFQYSEDSGFNVAPDESVQPKDGTTVKVMLEGRRSSWGGTDRYATYLYNEKDHGGAKRDLYDYPHPLNMFGDEDILDQVLIANIGASATNDKTQPNFGLEKSVSTSQIPDPGESGLYLGVLDLKMKTTKEDTPSLGLNPRGGAFDTRDWDGGDRSNPQWEYELTKIDDLASLQLVGDPEGHGFWGEGRTVSDGSMNAVLFEVPQLPLSSLGQLQHVNTGVTGSSGSMQIGNSFPHPGLSNLSSIVGERSTVSGGFSSVKSQVLTDMSWALNESLWDRYFFSGMNWGDANLENLNGSQEYETQQEAVEALIAGDRSKAWPLQNPRIGLFDRNVNAKEVSELLEYDKLGKYLAVFGGFNVNSTSERAWKSVFSALRDVDVTYVDNGTKKTKSVSQTFSRFMIPSDGEGQIFGSFRELSDGDIEKLSAEMVKQVKLRGPFMGLGDFVNRRLKAASSGDTDVQSVGALQAAIEAADLNEGKVDFEPKSGALENVKYKAGGKSRTISTYAGTSGYLLQGDVLSSLGSIMSVRSDTFVIRAYGASKNLNGKVMAEAWCEATVQRTPDWFVKTEEEPTRQNPAYPGVSGGLLNEQFDENPAFPELNRKMGRKFRIVSFRWLNKSEI